MTLWKFAKWERLPSRRGAKGGISRGSVDESGRNAPSAAVSLNVKRVAKKRRERGDETKKKQKKRKSSNQIDSGGRIKSS